jgi:hypothetical protein
MPIFEIEKDGEVYEVDAPTMEAAAGAFAPAADKKPGRDEPMAFLGEMMSNLPEKAGNAIQGTLEGIGALGKGLVTHPIDTAAGIVPGIYDHYSSRYGSPEARERTVRDDPFGMVLDMLPVGKGLQGLPAAAKAVPGVASSAAQTAGNVARAGLRVASQPAVSAGIGAVVGGVTGGVPGFIAGLSGGGQIPRMIKSAQRALREKPAPAAAAAPAAEMGSGALARELLAREPDWRTVDAVPIDAIKRKGIIEPGESRVGLSERMASSLREGASPEQLAEAIKFAKALRQRMHISEKAGRR